MVGDGAVKFISENVDYVAHRAVYSIAGGEVIELP